MPGFSARNALIARRGTARRRADEDNATAQMIAFMAQDRKLEAQAQREELQAQMELRREEERSRRLEREASERLQREEMHMRRQEMNILSMIMMKMVNSSNNNNSNMVSLHWLLFCFPSLLTNNLPSFPFVPLARNSDNGK